MDGWIDITIAVQTFRSQYKTFTFISLAQGYTYFNQKSETVQSRQTVRGAEK